MRAFKKRRFERWKILGYIRSDCTIEEFVQFRLSQGNLKPEETRSIVKTGKTLNEKLREEEFRLHVVTKEDRIGEAVQEVLGTSYPREVRIIKASEIDPGFYGEYTKIYHVYLKPSLL